MEIQALCLALDMVLSNVICHYILELPELLSPPAATTRGDIATLMGFPKAMSCHDSLIQKQIYQYAELAA